MYHKVQISGWTVIIVLTQKVRFDFYLWLLMIDSQYKLVFLDNRDYTYFNTCYCLRGGDYQVNTIIWNITEQVKQK